MRHSKTHLYRWLAIILAAFPLLLGCTRPKTAALNRLKQSYQCQGCDLQGVDLSGFNPLQPDAPPQALLSLHRAQLVRANLSRIRLWRCLRGVADGCFNDIDVSEADLSQAVWITRVFMALISPARGCMEARCAMLPVICVTFQNRFFPCVSEGFYIRRGCDARLGQPIRWREFRWGESQPRPPLWIIRSSVFLTRQTTPYHFGFCGGCGWVREDCQRLMGGRQFHGCGFNGGSCPKWQGFFQRPACGSQPGNPVSHYNAGWYGESSGLP